MQQEYTLVGRGKLNFASFIKYYLFVIATAHRCSLQDIVKVYSMCTSVQGRCRRQKDELPSDLYSLYYQIHCLSRTPMIGWYRGKGTGVVKLQTKQTMRLSNKTPNNAVLAKQTPKISSNKSIN